MNEKKIERILDPRFGDGEYEIASKFNEIIDVVNSLAKDMNSKEKCPHGEMFASRCHYCLDELGKTEKVPDLISATLLLEEVGKMEKDGFYLKVANGGTIELPEWKQDEIAGYNRGLRDFEKLIKRLLVK